MAGMLTKLLIAMDGSASSAAAQRLAIILAQAQGARMAGIAVIDTPWITRPTATGIGGSAYKVQMEVAQLRQAQRQSDAAVGALCSAAAEAGVACETQTREGNPAEAIEAEATTSDLLVLGRGATFHGGEEGAEISETALGLLARNPRPLLLVPAQPVTPERILLAFDASPPSSRCLHMLALLGLATGRRVQVLSIAETAAVAEARASAAAALLRAHGAEAVEPIALASEADPAELVIAQARSGGAGIVAMGAYGHRGLREVFFGSCTRALLRRCPAALFVHH